MDTIVKCKLNGKSLVVSGNSIEIDDSQLQIELVKRLIECKALTPVGENPLPLFFNKYLRNYSISEVEFKEVRRAVNYDMYDDYVDAMLSNSRTGLAA